MVQLPIFLKKLFIVVVKSLLKRNLENVITLLNKKKKLNSNLKFLLNAKCGSISKFTALPVRKGSFCVYAG